jgi:hypothetical protein
MSMSSTHAQAESLQAHRNAMLDKLRAVKPFVLDNSLRETDVAPLRGHVLKVGADFVLTWLIDAYAKHAYRQLHENGKVLATISDICCA